MLSSIAFKKYLNVFIISGFVSLLTLTYIGSAYSTNGCPSTINYELFPVFIPFMYGLFGLLNYYIIKTLGVRYSFIVGMLFGLVLSTIGRFLLNLPVLIFNFTKKTEHTVHMYAVVLYAAIFQFILTPLTTFVIV